MNWNLSHANLTHILPSLLILPCFIRSFARLLAVRSCCVASVGLKSSSRTQQSAQHSRTAACASLLSHPAVSHYYTTRARSLARSLIAHTLLFIQSLCTLIYFYNDLFFSFFLFGINRSLCCTAFFTLDEPSKWSGDLQTTKSRNNNTEKVCHPIVFARDYRI